MCHNTKYIRSMCWEGDRLESWPNIALQIKALKKVREINRLGEISSCGKKCWNSMIMILFSYVLGSFYDLLSFEFLCKINPCYFRAPLHGNPIVCWKFCCILHKVLRDGHGRAVPEATRLVTYRIGSSAAIL